MLGAGRMRSASQRILRLCLGAELEKRKKGRKGRSDEEGGGRGGSWMHENGECECVL